MKKNLLIISAALILALSVSGCGKKTNTSDVSPQQTAQTDVSDAYSQPADMDKVQGVTAVSETPKEEYSGKIGDYEVSIGDAKLVESEGEEIAIVAFTFKNKSSEAIPFSAAVDTTAYQGDLKLSGAVVTGIDGVNLLAMAEHVASGDTITVQQAYRLRDKSELFEVQVKEFAQTDEGTVLAKSFQF